MLAAVVTYAVIIILLCLIIKQAKIWFDYRSTASPLQTMPGDSLMSSPPFGTFYKTNFYGRKNSQKYGPIYRVQSMTRPVVILAKSKLCAEFFRDNQRNIMREKDFAVMGPIFAKLLGNAVGLLNAKQWQACRGVFKDDFNPKGVEQKFDVIQRGADSWIQKHIKHDAVVDLFQTKLNRLPLTILVELMYGPMTDREHQHIYEIAAELGGLMAQSMLNPIVSLPFFSKLPHSLNKTCQENQDKWYKFNIEIYERIRNGQANSGVMASVMRRLFAGDDATNAIPPYEKADKQKISELFDTLSEILLGNNDVTNVVLMTVLVHIASNKSVQQELANEIRRSASTNTSIDNSVDYETLLTLPYLDAVLKESARLRPLMAVTTPETLIDGITFGGYHIPAGSLIAMDVDSINHDPEVWPEPDKFDPTRFLTANVDDEESGSSGYSRFHFHRYGLNPRRQCLGFRYAEIMIKAVVWKILLNYNLEINGDRQAALERWDNESKPYGLTFTTPYIMFPQLKILSRNENALLDDN